MKAQHTAGPWLLSKDGNAFSVYVGSEHFSPNAEQAGVGHAIGICKVYQQANARLIAAAPELLEACKAIVACSAYWANAFSGERKALDLARAAIHKATAQAGGE